MNIRTNRVTETKAKTTSPRIRPPVTTQPAGSFHDYFLFVQQYVGNQAIRAWSKSGAAGRISVLNKTDLRLIQRSPYKAQILSLEEIASDAAKERLRKQSGQVTAKACRSINRDLTPDNCPSIVPQGEIVTVTREKVNGLWLQVECAGLTGFGPKEQCHVLGAFAKRLEPPKPAEAPAPQTGKKTPARPEPEARFPAETPPVSREGCPQEMSRDISRASAASQTDLISTIDALRERPLAPLTRDAMWLSLRTVSNQDAEGVVEILERVAKNLTGAKIACDKPGVIFCAGRDRGYVNPLTRTIHICKEKWETAGNLIRERALIHEGIHAFAGTTGADEKYHGDDCSESDVAGSGRSFRLRNTDSLACLVMLLTHSAETDLGARVSHSKGENLAVKQKPTGDISLGAEPQSTLFELLGYEETGLGRIRWIFRDLQGRKYLLLAANGEAIIAPDEDTDYVRGIYIGPKTRELLKERGVSDLELMVVCEIPEAGEKVNRINIHVIP